MTLFKLSTCPIFYGLHLFGQNRMDCPRLRISLRRPGVWINEGGFPNLCIYKMGPQSGWHFYLCLGMNTRFSFFTA